MEAIHARGVGAGGDWQRGDWTEILQCDLGELR